MSRKLKRSVNSRPEYAKDDNVIKLNFIEPKKKKIEIIPRNLNQEIFLEHLQNKDKHLIVAIGPAGCGKTYLGFLHAVKELKNGNYKRIVITRPNIAVDHQSIGFLPGDILMKMAPWVANFIDILTPYFNLKEITRMMEEKVIEVIPIEYMRGRSLEDSIIVCDEFQNLNKLAFKTVLTRLGQNSKMVITGDLLQSDVGPNNGLEDFFNRLLQNPSDMIGWIKFENSDIERHPLISHILKLYGE